MADTAQTLRNALEALWRDEATERLGRWRGDADAVSVMVVLQRHAWLGSNGARDAWEEARGQNQSALSATQQAALSEHLATFAARRAWLQVMSGVADRVQVRGQELPASVAWHQLLNTADPDKRAVIATALQERSAARWGAQVEARGLAEEHAKRWPVETSTPASPEASQAPADDMVAEADSFLRATEDATREIGRYVMRDVLRGTSPRWHDLLHASRASMLDGLVKPATRTARIALPFRQLGLERELSAHVRTEPMDAVNGVLPELAVMARNRDVRVGIPSVDAGVASELATLHAVTVALSRVLTSSSLSVEEATPSGPGIAQALGSLFAQCMADRRYVERMFGWSPREAEAVARIAVLTLLLKARRSAALVWLDAHDFADRSTREDRAREACTVDVPFALFAGTLPSTATLTRTLDAELTGIAAASSLRERFDDDWYRNPRLGDVVRGAAARGPTFAPKAWLQELAGTRAQAAQRLIELAGA